VIRPLVRTVVIGPKRASADARKRLIAVATHCLLQQWSHKNTRSGGLKAKREDDDVNDDEGCVNQQQDEED
jgi:hypothetical protein